MADSGASFPPLDPGPSGNVPRVSLPGLFGMQRRFQQEWWYYVGSLYDTTGRPYSLMLAIARQRLWPAVDLVSGLTGIGWNDGERSQFICGAGTGIGAGESPLPRQSLLVPPVDDYTFKASMVPWLEIAGGGSQPLEQFYFNVPNPSGQDGWTFEYLAAPDANNPIGSLGSLYSLEAHGRGFQSAADSPQTTPVQYAIALKLQDQRGMVMQGNSGYVGPLKPGAGGSYECAQPYLAVQKGGTLRIDGQDRTIDHGYLWFDRQMVAPSVADTPETVPPPGNAEALKSHLLRPAEGLKPLYLGNWMSFALNGGLNLALAAFWQPYHPQWISGTKVDRPPQSGFGTVYNRLDSPAAMRNGGETLRARSLANDRNWDFDVNILVPDQPEQSPHWTSPFSGHTYASAWQIEFAASAQAAGLPALLYVFTISDNCEFVASGGTASAFEGAALVYADRERTRPLGHAFIEQMGFN